MWCMMRGAWVIGGMPCGERTAGLSGAGVTSAGGREDQSSSGDPECESHKRREPKARMETKGHRKENG